MWILVLALADDNDADYDITIRKIIFQTKRFG